jgi:small multidrug resistance pump
MSTAPHVGTWVLVAAAVLCNALAQLLMKKAGIVEWADWRQWVSLPLLSALGFYGVSFALTALVFARLPLSLISPLMAGAIFVLITLFSVLLLGETIGAAKLAGMAMILAGIALLSRAG